MDNTQYKHRILRALFIICLIIYTGAVQANLNIENWITDNGVQVYYVYQRELPMVDIELIFDAGSARDGTRHGLAHLTTELLAYGAGGMDADQITTAFDSIGAQYRTDTGRDVTSVGLRTLTNQLQESTELLATILSAPDFPEPMLRQVKARILTAIRKQNQEPGTIASIALFDALYGDHPYGHPRIGREETVSAISRDDVQNFYKEYFVASNVQISIVGDINPTQAEQLADSLTSGLAVGARPAPIPLARQATDAKEIRIPFDSQQAHVYVAQLAIGFNDADYFPLYVGNHILGGSGFGSRLLEEVRVQRGYAYSAWSYFVPQRMRGPFIVGFQTRIDQADDALTLVRELIAEYIENGPSADELQLSKQHIKGSFPLRVASNAQISSWLRRTIIERLTTDYVNTFTEKTEQVSQEQIINSFKKHIQPDKMTAVIVGG
ncbi:MAG: insulinase family protein [Chromatiales bacterium]|nr:insulinase family protein [Chromatiales bacterium]